MVLVLGAADVGQRESHGPHGGVPHLHINKY